jgi:hypothetical protein
LIDRHRITTHMQSRRCSFVCCGYRTRCGRTTTSVR